MIDPPDRIALREYGQHKPECRRTPYIRDRVNRRELVYFYPNVDCTCGFDQALAAPRGDDPLLLEIYESILAVKNAWEMELLHVFEVLGVPPTVGYAGAAEAVQKRLAGREG